MDTATLLWILLALVTLAVVLLSVLLSRRPGDTLEHALREEQRAGRGELREQLDSLSSAQGQRIDGFGRNLADLTLRTDARLDELRVALTEDARKSRSETSEQQQRHAETMSMQLRELTARNEQRIVEMRATLESQLKSLQAGNEQKLEQMRATVDEKLQATLETRLGESFRLVSERLEAVQRGLGEMQSLASGVGDLKRVLTNIKSRGGWGEVQLENILEQTLTADQYARSVKVRAEGNEMVDFAVRLPGNGTGDEPVWLPLDSKFPHEDYERLLDAQELGDGEAVRATGAQLERAIRIQAKSIGDKYIVPPRTTDFAVMFLPTEGLYAEVIRRPGLVDLLQREHRVVIAGPTTVTALLNSLQMGFRTLAIEQRSSEVWRTLGAVKAEFGKFGVVLDGVHKKLQEASNKIDETSRRSRAMSRALRGVEAMPGDESRRLLGLDDDADAPRE